MTTVATALMALALQSGWTWTLYQGDGPLVLANEIPDTPQLQAVLQCTPGSGIARIDLYGAEAAAGVATLASGRATATTQAEHTGDHRTVSVRADHPVFGQFVLSGTLDVTVAGRSQSVEVQSGHLAKLRRFAELCGG